MHKFLFFRRVYPRLWFLPRNLRRDLITHSLFDQQSNRRGNMLDRVNLKSNLARSLSMPANLDAKESQALQKNKDIQAGRAQTASNLSINMTESHQKNSSGAKQTYTLSGCLPGIFSVKSRTIGSNDENVQLQRPERRIPYADSLVEKTMAKFPLSPKTNAYQTYTDPSQNTSELTKEFALQQTILARKALYTPATMLAQELQQAATKLHQLYTELTPINQDALGARILGTQGLLPGKDRSDLGKVLEKVAQNNRVNANDRAIVIALMGDMGALYADTGATTGTARSKEASAALRSKLNEQLHMMGLHVPNKEIIQDIQKRGGSDTVGPNKKQERTRPSYQNDLEIPLRTGIHNRGKSADEVLEISQDDRLRQARWAVAQLDTTLIQNTTEPLAGHMSGSPAEILQVWDMLRGEKPNDQYMHALDSHRNNPSVWDPMHHLTEQTRAQHYARAAGAAAFLIGNGYHSAVEVTEGILNYTGQSLRSPNILDNEKNDAATLFGHGAATSLIGELLDTNAVSGN